MEFTRPRGTRGFLFDEMRERKKAESIYAMYLKIMLIRKLKHLYLKNWNYLQQDLEKKL